MSFDLFLAPLPDTTWGDAERTRIIDILFRGVDKTDRFWSVQYADGSGAREICGLARWEDEDDGTRCLCFRRFGGRTFSDRLYELADRLDAMVFWPGIPPMVAVTREDLYARRPAELAPGDVVVVRDADDLMAHICK